MMHHFFFVVVAFVVAFAQRQHTVVAMGRSRSTSAGVSATPPPSIVLRSVYADHMVMQHSTRLRIVGHVVSVGDFDELTPYDWTNASNEHIAGKFATATECVAACAQDPSCNVVLYVNGTVHHGECWLSPTRSPVARRDFCSAAEGQTCASFLRRQNNITTTTTVSVAVDQTVVGFGTTNADGSFKVEISAQPTSTTPHTIIVSGTNGTTPVTISDVLFGDVYLCSGQSNMALSVKQVDNATAEIASAHWPLVRVAQVAATMSLVPPQNNTAFTIPWSPVTPVTIPTFSGLCYYFGREMFLTLNGTVPIGLVEAAIGGTYIQSFMPPTALVACNNTGTEPPGWIGAPTGPGHPTPYVPWGAQNQPSVIWNAMLTPLHPLSFKLAIFDQAEHNLATREADAYACLQREMVSAWRDAWGANLTYHFVQLPSFNISEYWWIYLDPLGEIRLSQSSTTSALPGVTSAVTIDLADLHSPYGSVHNRQKQQVAHRVALGALSVGYHHAVNTGPIVNSVEQQGQLSTHDVDVMIKTNVRGVGEFNGSVDCKLCCSQSPFEVSVDGKTWLRVLSHSPPTTVGPSLVSVTMTTVSAHVRVVRYGYDALVQCPYFDSDGLPLAPFRIYR